MSFRPETLTVRTGDTVVWVNKDIVPHTATASSAAGTFDTGNLAQGDAGRYVAQHAGAVEYTCTLHPVMKATLIIKE
jgi:plastocyanin